MAPVSLCQLVVRDGDRCVQVPDAFVQCGQEDGLIRSLVDLGVTEVESLLLFEVIDGWVNHAGMLDRALPPPADAFVEYPAATAKETGVLARVLKRLRHPHWRAQLDAKCKRLATRRSLGRAAANHRSELLADLTAYAMHALYATLGTPFWGPATTRAVLGRRTIALVDATHAGWMVAHYERADALSAALVRAAACRAAAAARFREVRSGGLSADAHDDAALLSRACKRDAAKRHAEYARSMALKRPTVGTVGAV
jgi:hypothetical protein